MSENPVLDRDGPHVFRKARVLILLQRLLAGGGAPVTRRDLRGEGKQLPPVVERPLGRTAAKHSRVLPEALRAAAAVRCRANRRRWLDEQGRIPYCATQPQDQPEVLRHSVVTSETVIGARPS